MKIYMDNCCYNRLSDDRSNIKNYLEREAVLLVLELIHALYQYCVLESVFANSEVIRRAKEISKFAGTTSFDSLHLALSEKNAEVFLTTDMKLVKASKRIDLSVKVMNPIEFLMEVTESE